MKARIKSNGKIVEVISRFMPRKRNAASRDWVCNLSDGTCIDESQLEYIEESIGGLDEAADAYAEQHGFRVHYDGTNNNYDEVDVKASKDGFIAGAKWQKEQMMDEWLKDRDGCFWDGVNEGKKAMKEQMMKDAVEGDFMLNPYPIICLDDCKDYNFKDGRKVRIIIVKEDEK